MKTFLTLPLPFLFHPAVFPADTIACPTFFALLHVYPKFLWTLCHSPSLLIFLLSELALSTTYLPPQLLFCCHPHLPLLFSLSHGLRKMLSWQRNCLGSKHTFLLQGICPCNTHTTSQAWVLHIHQHICRLNLELLLSSRAKMLLWWNNKRKDQEQDIVKWDFAREKCITSN